MLMLFLNYSEAFNLYKLSYIKGLYLMFISNLNSKIEFLIISLFYLKKIIFYLIFSSQIPNFTES